MWLQTRLRKAGPQSALALAVWFAPQIAWAHGSGAVPGLYAGFHLGALGDFDGDRQPDVAVAWPQGAVGSGYRYRIDVHLSAHAPTTFEIDSQVPDGLRLCARDIDGDHDLDLVVTSEFGRELVGVWINDGNGNFSQGQADIDPSSIWQEAAHHAAPCRDETPPAPALAGNPTGAMPDSSRFEPIYQLALSFPASAARATSARLNPGSPLRAPPTSWR